jgi:hypothetical protein
MTPEKLFEIFRIKRLYAMFILIFQSEIRIKLLLKCFWPLNLKQ